MPLDFIDSGRAALHRRRAERGLAAHVAGLSAEEVVARHYRAMGHVIAARRWRGLSGEIDLIVKTASEVIFVEVKQARTHDLAAGALGHAQILRIHGASDEYVDQVLGRPFIERQYHLALVDTLGRIAVIEDAFML